MEQKFFIDSVLLDRLVDKATDTRVRALQEISSILKNNIPFNGARESSEEISVVDLSTLVRQLIKWFQFRPVWHEAEVLDLLISIISRRDFLRHIVKNISINRLQKEFAKIGNLVFSDETRMKLQTISRLLSEYGSSILIDYANRTGSFSEVDSPQFSMVSSIRESALRRRSQVSSPMTSNPSKCQEIQVEVKEFWEVLNGLNLDTFNGIDAELLMFKEVDTLRNVLNFLQASVDDYPPEFFFQPPNIVDSLMDIMSKVPKEYSMQIIKIIRFVINGLRDRWLASLKHVTNPEQNIVSVKKHVNNILRMLTNFFERFHDSFSPKYFKRNHRVLNEIYLLLLDLATFIGKTNNACEIFINELMNMIAKVAKDLRLSYATAQEDSGMIRMHYMLCLYVTNVLVLCTDTRNISAYCDNNDWEFESDVALLDGPLKISSCNIYSLVKRNRKSVNSDDKELTLLLEASSSWKPVVKIFKEWETLSDEDIIFTGLQALNTIRIHRSLELVDLLLSTVKKCAEKFKDNVELKEAAEEVFLRLLSIEIPEIRRKAYTFVCTSVRDKASDEISPESASLCTAVGIPLTTEIITEILCFGFMDSDQEIHKQVRLILYFFLRAKVIFQNHWAEVLNIIKPILPMTPSLCRIDTKLGSFSFDVFQPHSVFDDSELNLSYARFLYCSFPLMREEAKKKLLSNLKIDSSLVAIVPDDFCIVPDLMVKDFQTPDVNIGYDEQAYETTFQVLRSINRSEPELLHSVLLQLCVLMNSQKLCQKSHDDNLWVFFMASLDMGFPDNIGIRQQTINILYKWVVCVPSFRIYLANEPSVLEFLVKTLVFFQDDPQIKQRTSWLLFLLLFSDFIVTSGRNISMPQFLSQLCCPFKFDEHWTESPFNKISALEQLNEEMESHSEASDIREISQRYLKFSFAFEWFPLPSVIINMRSFNGDAYLQNCSEKTLKVCESLQLTQSDIVCVRQTNCREILNDLCYELDNSTEVYQALDLITQTQSLLIFPVADEAVFTEKLDKKISRLLVYSDVNLGQQQMLIGFLQIYKRIMNSMKDDRIVVLMENKFIQCLIMENIPFAPDVLIEGLNVIECVVKLCGQRPSLMELLVKSYEQKSKVFLPTRLVEKLSVQIFGDVMKDGKWHEAGRRPIVKTLLTLLLNVLTYMPVHLDDAFLNGLFEKFLAVPKPLYRSHLDHIKAPQILHVNSSMLKLVFGIILRIASSASHINMKAEYFKDLMFWAMDEQRKYKALPWMIVAQLTKKKESFDVFCKGFQETMRTTLVNTVLETLSKKHNITSHDLKALAAVYGNILDHSTEIIDASYTVLVVVKLIECNNISALCFIVRKMVQNDLPGSLEMITSRRLIRKFLNTDGDYSEIADQFETITTCYKFKPLSKHVTDTVTADADVNFMHKLCDTKTPAGTEFKKFNSNAFNVLLILMSTESGLMKIARALSNPQVIDGFMFASHDSLRVTNPYNEMMSMLCFWNLLLDACEKFDSPIMERISSNRLDVSTENCVFLNPECNEKLKAKFGSVLEKEFNRVRFSIDLLFLQIVSIFEFIFASKFSSEYKHDMKALCFIIIKKLTSSNERVKQLSTEINLLSILTDKLNLSLMTLQISRHLETTKKFGVQKCQFMTKDFIIFLKALMEWNLPLAQNSNQVKEIFKKVLKVSDWIDSDSVLMNCFLNLLQVVSVMDIGRSCVTSEINGKPLIKVLLLKTQLMSSKPPHTDNNMSLIRNGISTLKTCSRFVEVRAMLKNAKVFQILEVLHPQIYANKKTTWDDVTIEWLKFFEFLSRFDDTECVPICISVLCRLFRLGNPAIKRTSLVIIRNFSLKASIGFVLLSSDDFKEIVDSILTDSTDIQEKFIILQTLLGIASKSEQLKAKLKNSSLNRKLKDQLQMMESEMKCQSNPEYTKNLQLTYMLHHVLYPKE